MMAKIFVRIIAILKILKFILWGLLLPDTVHAGGRVGELEFNVGSQLNITKYEIG